MIALPPPAWSGLYLIDSTIAGQWDALRDAAALDFPGILGITLVVAAIYRLVNLMVDLSYALLDPRVVSR